MTWVEMLNAAVLKRDTLGYGALTEQEKRIVAYAHTATANVAFPRDLR